MKDLDAAVTEIPVTADLERKVDFSQAFLNSGLGVAVRKDDRNLRGSIWLAVIQPLITVVAVVFSALMIAGTAIWLVERRHHPEHFGGKSISGFGQGVWWSAVTMTAVGYGDVAPRTLFERIVAIVWMFMGVVIVSLFTAFVASRLTAAHFGPVIHRVGDLSQVTTCAIRDSGGTGFLSRNGIQHRLHDNPQQALDALRDRKVEAVVHDQPSLHVLAMVDYPEITVLPTISRKVIMRLPFRRAARCANRLIKSCWSK